MRDGRRQCGESGKEKGKEKKWSCSETQTAHEHRLHNSDNDGRCKVRKEVKWGKFLLYVRRLFLILTFELYTLSVYTPSTSSFVLSALSSTFCSSTICCCPWASLLSACCSDCFFCSLLPQALALTLSSLILPK